MVMTVGLKRPNSFLTHSKDLPCPLGVFKDSAFCFPVGDPIVCDQYDIILLFPIKVEPCIS